MKKIYTLLLALMFFWSCKNAEADLSGNEKISAENFLKAFPGIILPVIVADTALKNFEDSIVISKTVFTQFINDTALKKFIADPTKTIIHPAGGIHTKEKDFLLATFTSGNKINLGVFVLDDKHKFLSSFLLTTNEKDGYKHSVSITEEPTFILKREKFINSISYYSRNGFAYSASTNSFAKVLSDSNEDTARTNEVINPIDTLTATNKFSGDYIADKNNFISVRDGKNATSYAFFIHFEKNANNCTGELKGSMSLTDEKNAVFTESGDPCVIHFKFTANSIIIKEENNCGNHRGITCPFDFTFKKKKQEKKKT